MCNDLCMIFYVCSLKSQFLIHKLLDILLLHLLQAIRLVIFLPAFKKEQKGKENRKKEAAEKRKQESSESEQEKKQKNDESMEEVTEEANEENS